MKAAPLYAYHLTLQPNAEVPSRTVAVRTQTLAPARLLHQSLDLVQHGAHHDVDRHAQHFHH